MASTAKGEGPIEVSLEANLITSSNSNSLLTYSIGLPGIYGLRSNIPFRIKLLSFFTFLSFHLSYNIFKNIFNLLNFYSREIF